MPQAALPAGWIEQIGPSGKASYTRQASSAPTDAGNAAASGTTAANVLTIATDVDTPPTNPMDPDMQLALAMSLEPPQPAQPAPAVPTQVTDVLTPGADPDTDVAVGTVVSVPSIAPLEVEGPRPSHRIFSPSAGGDSTCCEIPSHWKRGCCGFWSVAIAIVSIVLFIFSFKYIEYDDIALKKNLITNHMDLDNVYEGGRHLWLVNYSPVPFPATYQFVDFDSDNELVVFDKKGMTLQLYSSFQYRIVKKDLGKLFQRWGYSFHDQVVNIARAHLKNQVASLFDADDYFRDRLRVQETLRTILTGKLQEELFVEVPHGKFQLRQVVLPPTRLMSLQRIVVAKQANIVKQLEIDASVVRMQTKTRVEQQYNVRRYWYEQMTDGATLALRKNSTFRAQRERARAVAQGHVQLASNLGVSMNSQLYVNMCRLLAVQNDTVLATGIDPKQLQLLYKPSDAVRRRGEGGAVLSNERLQAALAAGAVD
jgi:hypothetical protein